MLKIETRDQVQLLAAAATAFDTIVRLNPPDRHALAAIGLLTAALAPSYQELVAHHAAAGYPAPDEKGYAEMLAAARGFAITVVTAGEVQN